ncbi:MAG: hypothetical protein HN350_14010 [Phycisphaerales bacterium]|nr:hypothetical protein [Phycisphaerales bacterium]
MTQEDTTFPLSAPSWTWDLLQTSPAESGNDKTPQTKPRKHRCVSSVAELPSRRWLMQASRKL